MADDSNSLSNTIPPPPRLTGEPTVDIANQSQWNLSLFKALVLQGQFVSTANQFTAQDFDASNLPDPAASNIATAQQAANEAYIIASAALALARRNQAVIEEYGTVQISGTDTSAAVTFSEELDDADFEIIASALSTAGTPAADALIVAGITSKATTGFTLNCHTAPGSGNSVTFAWALRRAV